MRRFYFGVDVGGTFTKTALMDERCRIVHKGKISSRGFSSKPLFLKSIREDFSDTLTRTGISLPLVKGIGIGLPGPVDSDRGVVLSLTNIKGWDDFPLVRYMKSSFKVPIFIENDANCMALAEVRMGAAKGARYALCLTLGTGVGGGIIFDDEIYRGPYFLGGEVGHIPLSLAGPECGCGGIACLERYVGNRELSSRVKKAFGRDISLEEAGRLARRGDRKALKIWEDAGERIGLAVSGIVNVFNPEVIVVGGGVAQAGDVLIKPIRRTVERHAMKQLKKRIRIKRALLGGDAGVLGAALLAKGRV